MVATHRDAQLSTLTLQRVFDILLHHFRFRDSSMVEHAAVNRRVAGSSPARGAFTGQTILSWPFFGGAIPWRQGLDFRMSLPYHLLVWTERSDRHSIKITGNRS
jgi:hypothetical protein